jgi:hypothetical protein
VNGKDCVIGYATDAFGPGMLFNINRKGHGLSQPHDMCLYHNEEHGLWVFATQDDYWIQFSDGGEVIFNKKDSLGSLLVKEDRFAIGDIWDNIKREYNPDNLILGLK